MPATGFTPIQLFHSSTSGTLPTTTQLFTGEIFWNIADNKVYGLNTGGTALQTIVGSLGNQNANTVAITGGSINGTSIGATTPSTGNFTSTLITGNGNISISGTTFSSPVLNVGSASSTTGSLFINTTIYPGVPAYNSGIGFSGQLSSVTTINTIRSLGIYSAGFYSDLTFNTTSGTVENEVMRLFSSTGVSIGNTTDPGAGNLSVSGTVTASVLATTQTPTASTTASNYSVPIILNGTTYYIRLSSTA